MPSVCLNILYIIFYFSLFYLFICVCVCVWGGGGRGGRGEGERVGEVMSSFKDENNISNILLISNR